MASETDPLLPKGNSAPEITGYGFSKPATSSHSRQSPPEQQTEQQHERSVSVDKESSAQVNGGPSPLRTIFILFTIVVGLALVITLSFPGALKQVPYRPSNDSSSTIEARVDEILSDTPLIGLLRFCRISNTHF